ncbi:MAG: hypothetical protein FWG72_00980 [Oscillospiraceae bacterium]|nr:hypothetical protein [Oscillospiraceae bacterium]
MEWTLERVQKALRDLIEERLSQRPYTQEYVDRLVAKAQMELAEAGSMS